MQAGVFGLINNTHPPATKFLDNAVVGDGPPDERAGIGHVAAILGGTSKAVNESTEFAGHLERQDDDFAKEEGLHYADQFDLSLLDVFRGTWKDGALSAGFELNGTDRTKILQFCSRPSKNLDFIGDFVGGAGGNRTHA
jgi:hypothetical protein